MNRSFASLAALTTFATTVGLASIACDKGPAEPPPSEQPTSPAKPVDTASTTTTTSAAGSSPAAAAAAAAPVSSGTVLSHGGPDPMNGKFTLADATAGLKGTGPLMATIDTSNGSMSCKLFDDKSPITVANFVGLARGLRPWKAPNGDWVKRPSFDGTTFHRVIKGFMIQGGDPSGNGSGQPGYTIPDEIWGKHDHAGQLCMANAGHNTNGQQFFITDDAAAHLDGNYTIFGECTPVQTVHDIASVPLNGERPVTPVVIKDVTIARGAGK
jgi:peptidyl-prolyl cis-trans isomerase A (cyclophilin A)